MVDSVVSVTENYLLQPVLISKYKKILQWLSVAVLWKHELYFIQMLIDNL